MNFNRYSFIEFNYRTLYGKLFSALVNQFGTHHVNLIEDAIQNTFLKSLKYWHSEKIPEKKEQWLFIVARNDVLNQLKRITKKPLENFLDETGSNNLAEEDLRLKTILFIASSKNISKQAKIVLILKTIFGLNIREISDCTLTRKETIYKRIKRATLSLQLEFENKTIQSIPKETEALSIGIVEEILYAVFTIGFDSFDEKIETIVNEDLCLEALALAKEMLKLYQKDSTQNLLALFCFHLARLPAKIENGRLVSLFQQDKTKWNEKLMHLGFGYLKRPIELNRFYLEALIASRYMTSNFYDLEHWNEIIKLYKILLKYHFSPIVILNLCFALHQANRTKEALKLLGSVEKKLPQGHFYFTLVKAQLLKESDPKESHFFMVSIIEQLKQTIRRDHVLELDT